MKIKLIILFSLICPFFGLAQSTSINGVVTYFFNDNYGNRPDIGAKVFIIDSITNSSFKYQTVDSFINAKTYRGIYNSCLTIYSNYEEVFKKLDVKKKSQKASYEEYKIKLEEAQKDVDKYYKVLEKLGVETKEKFQALDKRAFANILKINQDNTTLKTVDGSGNFSVSVKPGVYHVLIISKNRTGSNITELMGQVYHKKVLIKENTSKDVSRNFTLY